MCIADVIIWIAVKKSSSTVVGYEIYGKVILNVINMTFSSSKSIIFVFFCKMISLPIQLPLNFGVWWKTDKTTSGLYEKLKFMMANKNNIIYNI